MLSDVLRACMQVDEILIGELLAPSRPRPRSWLPQVLHGPGCQNIALGGHLFSVLVLEVHDGLGRETPTLEVVQPLENVHRDGTVEHVLADQVSDVLARRGI